MPKKRPYPTDQGPLVVKATFTSKDGVQISTVFDWNKRKDVRTFMERSDITLRAGGSTLLGQLATAKPADVSDSVDMESRGMCQHGTSLLQRCLTCTTPLAAVSGLSRANACPYCHGPSVITPQELPPKSRTCTKCMAVFIP